MLRDVSLELARSHYLVSVIARDETRLLELTNEARDFGGDIHPLSVDVKNTHLLTASLNMAMSLYGPIHLVVDWASPKASLDIAKMVSSADKPCPYFHVLGSSAANPSCDDSQRSERFNTLANISYHEIILGFVIKADGSRWLTHEEICQGILTAIDQQASRFIVGTVEPWSARP